MPKYLVTGIEAATGDEVEISVDVATPHEIAAAAAKQGVTAQEAMQASSGGWVRVPIGAGANDTAVRSLQSARGRVAAPPPEYAPLKASRAGLRIFGWLTVVIGVLATLGGVLQSDFRSIAVGVGALIGGSLMIAAGEVIGALRDIARSAWTIAENTKSRN